jgi:hypothetical protein
MDIKLTVVASNKALSRIPTNSCLFSMSSDE